MYKVINLGHTFEATGEPRVRILDSSLVKTASTGIQNFWDGLSENDQYSYLWVIGVSASEYYGCNNNGDAFTEDQLKQYHPTFLENAHVFLHHVNKDPEKSIGKPIYTFYNDTMHRAELILQIDKSLPSAGKTVEGIKNGEDIGVSMGCRVEFDVCSICGHQAKSRKEYCEHTRYNMKAILPDGRQVFVYNPKPQFFDISVVNKPADPIALTLDKVASEGQETHMKFAAEVGEESELYTKKLAAIDKMSDILKKVDGMVTDVKDGGEELNILKNIDLDSLDYPVLGFGDLEALDASPGGVIQVIISSGAPPSLSEMAYACGKKEFGDSLTEDTVSEIFSIIPQALRFLRMGGAPLENIVAPMFDGMADEDVEEAVSCVSPKLQSRRLIIKQAADPMVLQKFAEQTMPLFDGKSSERIPAPPAPEGDFPAKLKNMMRMRSAKGPGFYDQFHVTDDRGKKYKTDRRSVLMADEHNTTPRSARKLLGAALGTAALGALFSEPDLARRLLTSSGLGLGAYASWNTTPTKRVQTDEGYEVPANTLFHEKKAGKARAASFARDNIGTLIGLSVPAALGLDYAYNKNVKYRGVPQPERFMGKKERAKHQVGQKASEHPFSAALTGGLAGVGAHEGVRKLLSRLPKAR